MDDRTLAFTPAWKQRDMIAAKQISPVELTELYLRRIDSLNPQLNAYLTVVGDLAIGWAKDAEAAVMRRRRPRPPSRRSHLHQRPERHQGHPNHQRLPHLQGRRPRRRRHRFGANPRVRRHHSRQDEHAGDGPQGFHRKPARPPVPQPVGPHPHPRRLQRRRGGGTGGRPFGTVAGKRRRRFDSDFPRPIAASTESRAPRAASPASPPLPAAGASWGRTAPSPPPSRTPPSSSRPSQAPTPATPSAYAPTRRTFPPAWARA